VLFLDIDGVLLPERQLLAEVNREARRLLMADKPREAGLASVFDAACVTRLNRLCAETGARLVVHSNWRALVVQEETRRHLVAQGVDGSLLHPLPCGFDPKHGVRKPDDIWAWICANRPAQWAVVDDDHFASPDGPLPLVRPDPIWGLDDVDCAQLAELLTRGEL
jgi:hypothetical protein